LERRHQRCSKTIETANSPKAASGLDTNVSETGEVRNVDLPPHDDVAIVILRATADRCERTPSSRGVSGAGSRTD
jgi:glucokinase